MAAKLLTSVFKDTFEVFMNSKGYRWYDSCFAKFDKGIFTRVFALNEELADKSRIDVVSVPIPAFCNITDDIHNTRRIVISADRLADAEHWDIGGCDTQRLMKELLKVYRHNYERFCAYNSLEDFAEKITEYERLTDPRKAGRKIYDFSESKMLEKIDLCEFLLILHRAGKTENFEKMMINAITVYRNYIYEKIHKPDANDKTAEKNRTEQVDPEIEKMFMDKVTDEYDRLVRFAEAVVGNNIRYISQVDAKYDNAEIRNEMYINRLLAG
ncbi:MAG: hypothetical protein LUF33_08550 [Clostridiales bacterium]|nr:hypothetical protein [Clostridiales bacterium]